jgi:uncharacterized membrane protein
VRGYRFEKRYASSSSGSDSGGRASRFRAGVASRSRIEHLLFEISVIGKGVDGVLELVGGALLFFVSPAQIHSLLRALTQHELSEDPHDFVARHLLNGSSHVTAGAATFAAAYLLWHGAVKVGLVVGLLLKRRWAYPVAIAAFIVFVLYQMYRWSHTRSAGLLALSALDVIVIALTWLEYKRLESVHGFARR